MTKYINDLVTELKDLKKGIGINAALWARMPVTEAQLQTAIDALETQDVAIDSAAVALQQQRTFGRNITEQYKPLAAQTENLASGILATNTEKLLDYGIKLRKDASTIPVPAKAMIASIIDDYDGEGFIVTYQSLENADSFEVEKGMAPTPDVLVLQPPYSHYKTTKKLTFTDDDVKRGQRYFYRVRGLNRNGYGEWSEPVSRVQ